MKKYKEEKYSKKINDVLQKFVDTPFMQMDVCCHCGGYDTIQTYVEYKGKFIHICEKCTKELFEEIKG